MQLVEGLDGLRFQEIKIHIYLGLNAQLEISILQELY